MNATAKTLLRTSLIGLALGLLTSCAVNVHYAIGGTDVVWANWQLLGQVPEPPVSIAGIASGRGETVSIVVASADQYFHCCITGAGNWREVPNADPFNDLTADTHHNPGVIILNQPGSAVDTAIAYHCGGFCSNQRHYVVQANGTVWTWSQAPHDETFNRPSGLARWYLASGLELRLSSHAWLLGTVLGLVLGAVLARRKLPAGRYTFGILLALAVAAVVVPDLLANVYAGSLPQVPYPPTPTPTPRIAAAPPATVTPAPTASVAVVEGTPATASAPAAVEQLLIRPGANVLDVAFSPDGRLVAGAVDFSVRVWDAKSGVQLHEWRPEGFLMVSVAFSPDSTLLAVHGTVEQITVLDVANGHVVYTLSGHSPVFSPDGALLAAANEDGTIHLVEAATGTEVRVLTGTAEAECLAFSPDGRLLAAGGNAETATLWDPTTGAVMGVLPGQRNGVVDLAFSPDGRWLVTAETMTLRIWEVSSQTAVHTLAGHSDYLRSVAVSPDGRLVASGSQDNTSRLWDPETGRLVQVLTRHVDTVHDVAFSPDGRTLATASSDQTLVLWTLAKTAAP